MNCYLLVSSIFDFFNFLIVSIQLLLGICNGGRQLSFVFVCSGSLC